MKIGLLLISSLFISSVAFAEFATSGDLDISGTVGAVNELQVNRDAATADSLSINSASSSVRVATVDERSNNLNGYKIEMYSSNAGKLVHGVDNTKFVGYQMSYDGGALVAPQDSSNPVEVKNVSSLSGLTLDTSDVDIQVSHDANAVAGTYSDTITFSISAN